MATRLIPSVQSSPMRLVYTTCSAMFWECCNDGYSDYYYRNSPSIDPQGDGSDDARALRGGYWGNDADDVRSAWRSDNGPAERNDAIAFRVVAMPRTH